MKKQLLNTRKALSKLFGISALLLFSASFVNAQNVGSYQLTATTGTFTPLVGATNSSLTNTEDDAISANIAIGFTFLFEGVQYTQLRVASNGYLIFGTNGTSAAGNDLTTTTTTLRPGVAPLWDDLQCTQNVKFLVSGTAPNRVFTAEWLNMEWNYQSTTAVISFQVSLFETSNQIECIYRQEATNVNTASGGASIGLMGAATGNFLSLQDVSASPTVSSTVVKNDITTKPATGQIYRFSPPAQCTQPVLQPTLSATNATATQINLSITPPSPAPSHYLIVRYPAGAPVITDPLDSVVYSVGQAIGAGTVAAFTTSTTPSITGLTLSTAYDFYVYSVQYSGSACVPSILKATPTLLNASTSGPLRVLSTATGGVWANPTTWVGGAVPNSFDTAEIVTGANVTVNAAASIGALEIKSGAIVQLNANLTDSSDLIIASGGTLNAFFGTTGRQLTVIRDIQNNGLLNMNMPGSILALTGTITPQTISGSGTYSIIPTLTVNNPNGITLSNNLTVPLALNLTRGIVSGAGTITMGSISFAPTFTMTSNGGTLACAVASGLAELLPANVSFIYNAPTPVASITTGNELTVPSSNLNITFNAIAGGNYSISTNVTANNLTINDTVDVNANTMTVNGVNTFNATAHITGAGTYTMGPNATLSTTNLVGIAEVNNTGSVRTATRNYSTTGNYTFNGASGQTTGDGIPSVLAGGTVTFSTTAGTILGKSITFNNITLTTTPLNTNNFDITLNGLATLGTNQVSGTGGFIANATARISLANTNASGVIQNAPSINGNIINTGLRTFATGVDFVFTGAPVATGNGFPTTGVDTLILNHTSTLVLTAATSVNTLQINNTGVVTTTPTNMLTVLGDLAQSVSRTSTGYINGPLTRTISTLAFGGYTFPLGAGTTGNLGIELINPTVSGSSITLTAVARSLNSTGTAGTGLTAINTNRYWAFAPVGGAGTLTGVQNIRIFDGSLGVAKKIGAAVSTGAANTYNSIGGTLDSNSFSILSGSAIPTFGSVSDSTFFVLGAGTASGTFAAGTYSVGPTGNYFSLTSALAAINEAASLTGPVVLEFQSTYTPNVESYPIVLRNTLPTTPTNTLTIRPSLGVSSTIAFAASTFNSLPVFEFSGGSNIIFDGRPGGTGSNRRISITQRSVGTFPTIRFINGANNNTLNFLSVFGNNNSTSSGVIFFSTSTNSAVGNSSITISNSEISGLLNSANLIFSSGSTAPNDNKNNTISNNNIFNFFVNGTSSTGVLLGSGSSNWTVTTNNFYQTQALSSFTTPVLTIGTGFRAIQLNNTATNAVFTLTNNRIGGNIPGIPGSVFIIGDSASALAHLFRPIDCSNVGTTSPTSIQGNTISDITVFSNGADNFTGIGALQAGRYNVGTITPNIVGSTTSNGSIKIYQRSTTASTCRGYHFTGTGGGEISNNIASGIDITVQGAPATNGAITFIGLQINATFTNPLIANNNTIGSATMTHSIQGLQASVGAVGIIGIQANAASGAAVTISNNTIANLTSFATAFLNANALKGINITGASSISTTVFRNIIRNLRIDAPNSNIDINSAIIGIHNSATGAGPQIIVGNTIHSLASTFNGPVTNSVQGILYNSSSSSTASRIENNRIHSLETGTANTIATQIGINVSTSATVVRTFNNFVRLGVNSNGTTNNLNISTIGILKQSTSNTVFAHNTVYLAGSPAASDTNAVSVAFYKFNSSASDSVMNNVFANTRSNASGTGEHHAMRINNTTGLVSNANIYFANGTGASLFRNGFTRLSNMQAYRALSIANDSRSGIGNPLFNAGITNPAGTINITLATNSPAATAAINIAYITTDIDSITRPVAKAIGCFDQSLSALTAANDIYPPAISYGFITNKAAAAATLTDALTVTDVGVGVDVSGTNAPRIWYRNATTNSVWASVQPASNVGNANNATFTYTLNWTLIGGTPSPGDKIMYYFVAQDNATAPNISYSLFNATSPAHSSVGNQTTPPVLQDSFLIVAPLPTTITVPGDYPNLTSNTGLFNAINNAALAGNTIVTITGDIQEPGTTALTQAGMSGFSLLIQPDAALRTLWGNTTTNLIRINASNVTIDGGPLRNLRIVDSIGSVPSATVGATIEISGSVSNDTIVNCILEGNSSSATRGTLVLGSGTISNILIANNDFRSPNQIAANAPANAIFMNNNAISGVTIGGTTVRPGGNLIHDYTLAGVNINNGGNNFVIGHLTDTANGNKFYQGANRTTQLRGIIDNGGSNHIIGSNSIGGSAPDRSGNPTTTNVTTSTCFVGILASSASVVTGLNITNNTIGNIFSNTAGTDHSFVGIDIPSGNISGTITNNFVGGLTYPYDTVRCDGDSKGIRMASTGTVTISSNRVSYITNQSTQNDFLVGIEINSGSGNILDNTVSNLTQRSTSSLSIQSACNGIGLNTSTSNNIIRGNTVSYITNLSNTSGVPVFGIVNSAGVNTLIERNKVWYISGRGTTVPLVGGIASTGGTANILNNQIMVGDSSSGVALVNGIRIASTTGPNNVHYNTVLVNGISTGTSLSHGILRTSTGTVDLRNNVLFVTRPQLSTGRSYAIGSSVTTNLTSANINYNFMVVPDTNILAEIPAGTAFGWKSFDSLYTTSYNTNWAERRSVVPAQDFFTDTILGNLSPNTTSPTAWYINGKGIRVIGTTGDYNNASGIRSGSISTGATDIGAFEFTPSSTPPLAFVNRLPAANDSSQCFFGSRKIAQINWGNAGAVPGTLDVTYYSGVNPSNTPIGRTFMNAYWDIQAAGGSGFDYLLSLMQDSAVFGTVTAPNNLAIARYEGSGTVWSRMQTSVDNILGTMSADSTNTLGIFTGTDALNNPLPVSYVSFTGYPVGKDAKLNWITASETNNKGFEVERSVDGKSFNRIDFVPGAVNANRKNSYNYLDAGALVKNTVVYYRLKQVDLNGKYTYSNIVKVSSSNKAENTVLIAPNPFTSEINAIVTAKQSGMATINIVDLQGRTVVSAQKQVVEGMNTLQLNNLDNLQTGVYFIRIATTDEVIVTKVVKQ